MLPAQRQSHGRTRRRRAHDSLKSLTVTLDPLSGLSKQHHRACKESGYVRAGLRISVPKLGINADG